MEKGRCRSGVSERVCRPRILKSSHSPLSIRSAQEDALSYGRPGRAANTRPGAESTDAHLCEDFNARGAGERRLRPAAVVRLGLGDGALEEAAASSARTEIIQRRGLGPAPLRPTAELLMHRSDAPLSIDRTHS